MMARHPPSRSAEPAYDNKDALLFPLVVVGTLVISSIRVSYSDLLSAALLLPPPLFFFNSAGSRFIHSAKFWRYRHYFPEDVQPSQHEGK